MTEDLQNLTPAQLRELADQLEVEGLESSELGAITEQLRLERKEIEALQKQRTARLIKIREKRDLIYELRTRQIDEILKLQDAGVKRSRLAKFVGTESGALTKRPALREVKTSDEAVDTALSGEDTSFEQ